MAYTFKHGDRPLDGLTVQRAVGRGGFGEVYYALSDSGKQLAVKYLRENPEVELRGIAQVMNLKSPHLVTVYDVRKSVEGEPFVIMEYISGPSLREILQASPSGVGEQKAAYFVEGIGKGLAYLHERGIVHRDLKPGNIFYDDGYVKIGDYGLSKHISVSAHSGNTVSVGTVHYMAPEIGSGSYTKAIDIYALGVILFELLTGRLPFSGSSMGEILMRHLRENPDLSGIRAPFAQIIAKCLAKNPDERYQDANEMIDALMGITGIRETISRFDPMTLSSVPRDAGAPDPERTQTSPPPPRRVELDVHEAVRGDALPDIPPIPPIPGTPPRPSDDAGARPRSRDRAAAPPAPPTAPREPMPARWPQAVVVLLLAAASGMIAAMLADHDSEAAGFGIAFLLLGATLGSLVAHFALVQRMLTPHPVLNRIVYVSCACVAMAPGMAIASEAGRPFVRLAIPILATIAIVDWRTIIESGRAGTVGGGVLFYHAVIGLVAGSIGQTHAFLGAGIAAAATLIVQCAAAMWPLPRRTPASPPRVNLSSVQEAAGKAMNVTAETLQRAARKVEERFGKYGVVAEVRGPEWTPAPPPPPVPTPAAAPVIVDAYEPSFVGRTANAGLAALAKFILLGVVSVAILSYANSAVQISDDGGTFALRDGQMVIQTGDRTITRAVPRAALIAPALLATVLLMVARRGTGSAHVVRGLIGCLLAIGAVVVAIGPGAAALEALFDGRIDALRTNDNRQNLIGLVAMMAVSLSLLFWPRRNPHAARVISV